MPETQAKLAEMHALEWLECEITLGPLTIKTKANLAQVSRLILNLVKEYPELPIH